ncbi:uncharacterized protein DKFZp434B061-like [Penaeus monodon]|uniref:uncharacterized protein DKFZp434B061-like n=1 Tax=Penaeus monodon TaxID=6687 RepID=UPI0018A70B42|nr:uncharacterized protein DKFZp434B061-like [Penaeus monodon]
MCVVFIRPCAPPRQPNTPDVAITENPLCPHQSGDREESVTRSRERGAKTGSQDGEPKPGSRRQGHRDKELETRKRKWGAAKGEPNTRNRGKGARDGLRTRSRGRGHKAGEQETWDERPNGPSRSAPAGASSRPFALRPSRSVLTALRAPPQQERPHGPSRPPQQERPHGPSRSAPAGASSRPFAFRPSRSVLTALRVPPQQERPHGPSRSAPAGASSRPFAFRPSRSVLTALRAPPQQERPHGPSRSAPAGAGGVAEDDKQGPGRLHRPFALRSRGGASPEGRSGTWGLPRGRVLNYYGEPWFGVHLRGGLGAGVHNSTGV